MSAVLIRYISVGNWGKKLRKKKTLFNSGELPHLFFYAIL